MYSHIVKAIFVAAVSLASCKTTNIVKSSELRLAVDFCVANPAVTFDSFAMPVINADSLLRVCNSNGINFSEKDILLANATGTLTTFCKALRLNRDSLPGSRLQFMELQNRIVSQIESTYLQVEALITELSCEVERLKQIAIYLDNKSKRNNTRLIVASIVTGSATTIAPVWVKETRPLNVVAITGGLVAAGLGALSLHPPNKKANLQIDRNLLSDFWYVPEKSHTYPSSIWYLLTKKKFGYVSGMSIVETVRRRWMKFDLNNNADLPIQDLFYGKGGIYSSDDLITRSQMTAEILSSFELVRYSFHMFSLKVANIR
jgi:hypothetical protein